MAGGRVDSLLEPICIGMLSSLSSASDILLARS